MFTLSNKLFARFLKQRSTSEYGRSVLVVEIIQKNVCVACCLM